MTLQNDVDPVEEEVPLTTKASILESALQLLRRSGASGVKMRQIAEHVGVTAAALYRHFPNREAILSAIADLGFDLIGDLMEQPIDEQDPNERVLVVFDRYIEFAMEEPEIFDLMFRLPHSNVRLYPRDYLAGESRSGNVLIREVRRCFEMGVWQRDDIAAVVLAIWIHAHGLAVLFLAKRIEGDAREFHQIARDSMSRLIAGLRRG